MSGSERKGGVRELDPLFNALAKSRFRSRFHLNGKELQYLHEKGMATVMDHARDIIGKRLAPAVLANDGKQTPYRGHPVFVGQHATACCCRGCLHQWHGIESRRALSAAEIDYLLDVLARWLSTESGRRESKRHDTPVQTALPGF